jgi:hypothetical protein
MMAGWRDVSGSAGRLRSQLLSSDRVCEQKGLQPASRSLYTTKPPTAIIAIVTKPPTELTSAIDFSCMQHDTSLPAGLHESRPSIYVGFVQLNPVFITNLLILCVSLLPRVCFTQLGSSESGVLGAVDFQLTQKPRFWNIDSFGSCVWNRGAGCHV